MSRIELWCALALLLAAALAGCEQEDDADEAAEDPQQLSVSIESPANGSIATIGDKLTVRIRAGGPQDVTLVQWHSVALLNVYPLQIQYGRRRCSPPLHEVEFEDELNVPFNVNFRYIDVYAMAEDAAGNRAAAISRVQVQDYQP